MCLKQHSIYLICNDMHGHVSPERKFVRHVPLHNTYIPPTQHVHSSYTTRTFLLHNTYIPPTQYVHSSYTTRTFLLTQHVRSSYTTRTFLHNTYVPPNTTRTFLLHNTYLCRPPVSGIGKSCLFPVQSSHLLPCSIHLRDSFGSCCCSSCTLYR